jgi:hypothetical protein
MSTQLSPTPADQILLAGGNDRDVASLLDASPWLTENEIQRVDSSDEAIALLRNPKHRFALALVDGNLAPDPAVSLIQFVRRDPQSPYPGLVIGFIGDEITCSELRQTVRAGCLFTLSRPFDRQQLAVAVRRLPTDRSDFLVSGGYVGPERRRAAESSTDDRRLLPAHEQTLASTSRSYDISGETTHFRFKRLPAQTAAATPALAIRNGLPRAAVLPAFDHIGWKKKEGVSLINRQAQAMEQTWTELQATLAPKVLSRLNHQATSSARLASQRGLLLLAAITGSLAQYSLGKHRLGPRLVAFLRSHLDGVGVALRHRIDDDGGPTGRSIMSTLKAAERAFKGEEKPKISLMATLKAADRSMTGRSSAATAMRSVNALRR